MAGRLQAGPEARRYRDARWHADEHHGSGKAEGHGAESAAEVIFPIEAANSMYLAPLAGRGIGRLWRPSWKERRRQASATSHRRCDPGEGDSPRVSLPAEYAERAPHPSPLPAKERGEGGDVTAGRGNGRSHRAACS